MEQANNVTQFLEILKRFDGYSEIYYRGQSSQYNSITSSISRDEGYVLNEHRIYKESIEMKEKEFESLRSPFQRLSKLQHFGFPTRLIDVSIDPLVALFFAVQDVESKYDGLVYVYYHKSNAIDSKHVRLLALLATLKDYNFGTIRGAYRKEYGEDITEAEILDMSEKTTFVEYTEALKESNQRLFNQKGTFAICANVASSGKIQRKLQSLDGIRPSMIIRVPYEHKFSLKRELDDRYSKNETIIYPELPSVATYIKEKFKLENFSPDGTYSVIAAEDISTAAARRVAINIVLDKLLTIDQIKKIAISLIEEHSAKNDVVSIFVAKNGNDYIMRNWVLRGQWISPSLNPKFRPMPIGERSSDGYYWEEEKSYSVRADFYAQYAFDDDKNLYAYYRKTFEKIRPVFEKLLSLFDSGKFLEFSDEVDRQKEAITRSYLIFGEFGHSRNKEFDDYLQNFQQAVSMMDNIRFWVNREDLNEIARNYQISTCLRDTKKMINIIDRDIEGWRERLGLSQKEYQRIDPGNRPRNKYEFQYEQTIPVKTNALDVTFDVEICVNPDKTVHIAGNTNLFDKASLMMTVTDAKGKIRGQSTSEITDGKFDFGTFSDKGDGYKPGDYRAEISLSIPNVQPKEFVKMTGIEYENLTGPYVDRTGLGPTLRYEVAFIVD